MLCAPNASTPTISRPKVAAFRTTLNASSFWSSRGVAGNTRNASTPAISPKGPLTKNSQRHGATARIAAPMEGLAAENTATTIATLLTPTPSIALG